MKIAQMLSRTIGLLLLVSALASCSKQPDGTGSSDSSTTATSRFDQAGHSAGLGDEQRTTETQVEEIYSERETKWWRTLATEYGRKSGALDESAWITATESSLSENPQTRQSYALLNKQIEDLRGVIKDTFPLSFYVSRNLTPTGEFSSLKGRGFGNSFYEIRNLRKTTVVYGRTPFRIGTAILFTSDTEFKSKGSSSGIVKIADFVNVTIDGFDSKIPVLVLVESAPDLKQQLDKAAMERATIRTNETARLKQVLQTEFAR